MAYNLVKKIMGAKPKKHPYPEHMAYVREIAPDCMVLLKNENQTLPLRPGKLALFGAGAVDTVFCGTGSGYVFAPHSISCCEGLKKAGFQITSEAWLRRFQKASAAADRKDHSISFLDAVWSGMHLLLDDLPITEEELEQAARADTAVYVIRRTAGEGEDRTMGQGDFQLTDRERDNLTLLAEKFPHTAVVLNTCVIDPGFLFEISGIDAVLLMSLPGSEAGSALADVLTGARVPTGRLTDTWANEYGDYPASKTFAANDDNPLQEDYTEDIFVGYRYFDSFRLEPAFPFGYGLGYGRFRLTVLSAEANWNEITLRVLAENLGESPDREVVQLYVSSPAGTLPQPWQELRGFAKTGLVAPGENQVVTLRIPTERLASYDTDAAAFVMEAGDYVLRVGSHSRHTLPAALLRLDGTAKLRQVRNRLAPDHPLDLLRPETPMAAPEGYRAKAWDHHTELIPVDPFVVSLSHEDCVCTEGYRPWYRNSPERQTSVRTENRSTLQDVKAGKVTLEDFVSSLPEEVLFRLVAGSASETPFPVPARGAGRANKVKAPTSSGATTAQYEKTLGIPRWLMTDGPAGLHIMTRSCTAFPIGMALAQSWDPELGRNVGLRIGKELAACSYSVILGPGMNIHRDPLCGRNFEYFSEDPLLSGEIAAGYTLGAQSVPGTAVSIKHFACNNQETDRFKQNSTVSERALREIYLRGFELCVRRAAPKTVMTSYNCLNGLHTSSSPELLIDILRDEWGFDGLVMTDWGTESSKDLDLNAGNNLIMPGCPSDTLRAALDGADPLFAPDGWVQTEVRKLYGGFVKETVEHWNAFRPDKDGPDRVGAQVAAGTAVSQKVQDWVKSGAAEVEEHPDGSKTVWYRGTNRGSTLSRSVLEENSCVVLRQILDSLSYRLTYDPS